MRAPLTRCGKPSGGRRDSAKAQQRIVGGLCDSGRVRAQADDGVELNAEFVVEADGLHLRLVLESAGGRTAGSGRSRNDQYVPALTLLLTRLRDRRAILLAALVASARVSGLPESERALLQGPIDFADVGDIERLRLDLTSAQGRIGLPEGAAKQGNNRKRIQLRLAVPGYAAGDAARLSGRPRVAGRVIRSATDIRNRGLWSRQPSCPRWGS